jgi:hypothetical protein
MRFKIFGNKFGHVPGTGQSATERARAAQTDQPPAGVAAGNPHARLAPRVGVGRGELQAISDRRDLPSSQPSQSMAQRRPPPVLAIETDTGSMSSLSVSEGGVYLEDHGALQGVDVRTRHRILHAAHILGDTDPSFLPHVQPSPYAHLDDQLSERTDSPLARQIENVLELLPHIKKPLTDLTVQKLRRELKYHLPAKSLTRIEGTRPVHDLHTSAVDRLDMLETASLAMELTNLHLSVGDLNPRLLMCVLEAGDSPGQLVQSLSDNIEKIKENNHSNRNVIVTAQSLVSLRTDLLEEEADRIREHLATLADPRATAMNIDPLLLLALGAAQGDSGRLVDHLKMCRIDPAR